MYNLAARSVCRSDSLPISIPKIRTHFFLHRFPCTDLSPIRGFFTSDSLCSLVADPDTAAMLPSADSFYSVGVSVFSEAEKSPPLSSLGVCKGVSALFMCWLTGSKLQLGGGFAGP